MSMPDIDITGNINITKEQALNLILASIGMEELGLAHILNAEGEKIQAAVGTLNNDQEALAKSVDELLAINKSVEKTLRAVIKTQMLLQFKLEDATQFVSNIHPAISVQKLISVDGGNTYVDGNAKPYPKLYPPFKPMFKFIVKNTGNVTLTLVSLSDTTFGPISAGGTLAPGASFEVTKTGDFEVGKHCNIATVTGNYSTGEGTIEVESMDSACYIGIDCHDDIDIE